MVLNAKCTSSFHIQALVIKVVLTTVELDPAISRNVELCYGAKERDLPQELQIVEMKNFASRINLILV